MRKTPIDPQTFTQSVASDTWTCNHNRGFNPGVTVKVWYNGVLTEILPGAIEYPTVNQFVVRFSQPFSGEARHV